jgi:hypothetical protein
LNRPFGGFEVEALIAGSEIWWAVSLFLSPKGLYNTQGLRDFYGLGVAPLLALPWLFAGSLNLVGIVLFFMRRRSCAAVRFAGSSISTFIWFMVFIKTGIVLDWNAPYNGIYFFFGWWSIRLTFAAVARYHTPDELRWAVR